MDDADRAEELIRETLRNTIERARSRNGPLYAGVCLNCGEAVAMPRRWCDKACRDDWARQDQYRSP